MAKQNRTQVMMENVRPQIVTAVNDLLEQHGEEASQFIQSSESKKLTVTFSALIDFSESVGTVDTHIGFGQRVTDKRHADIDPPEQGQLIGREESPQPEGTGAKFVRNSTKAQTEEGELIEQEYQDENGKVIQLPKAAKKKKARGKMPPAID